MELLTEDILKLLFAVVIGGAIGAEREIRSKAAGFRTMILICVGSTLFTIMSIKIGGLSNPDRIAANIITGMGFIGAGVIFHEANHVTGLTTAASIWICAALGMSIGAGYFLVAGYTTIMVILVLWGFSKLEVFIDNAGQSRTYEIVFHGGQENLDRLADVIRECGLTIKQKGLGKRGADSTCALDVHGEARNHIILTQKLFADPDIVEFRF